MTRYNSLLIFSFAVLLNSSLEAMVRFEMVPRTLYGRFSSSASLPFSYGNASSEVARQATFVYEKYYTVLSDDATDIKENMAIVGVLNPCFFVGIRNEENGRCVVFHKMACNSIDSLIETAKQELQIKKVDGQRLQAHIFSNSMSFHKDMLLSGRACYDCVLINGETFRDRHDGKSHHEEMIFIKNSLLSGMGIDESRIKAHIFEPSSYSSAALSVLVDSKLQLQSICIAREKVFGGYFEPVEDFKEEDTLGVRATFLEALDSAYFKDYKSVYNTLPFVKLVGNFKKV